MYVIDFLCMCVRSNEVANKYNPVLYQKLKKQRGEK